MGEKQTGMMLEQQKGMSALCQNIRGREITLRISFVQKTFRKKFMLSVCGRHDQEFLVENEVIF